MVIVKVHKGEPIERALRLFDTKCKQARILQTVRQKEYYISPSERRHRKKARRTRSSNQAH
jgi:ribosomal protein S21